MIMTMVMIIKITDPIPQFFNFSIWKSCIEVKSIAKTRPVWKTFVRALDDDFVAVVAVDDDDDDDDDDNDDDDDLNENQDFFNTNVVQRLANSIGTV